MDINSLLSPQDTPKNEVASTSSSPLLSPTKNMGRPSVATRKSSGLSQQINRDDLTLTPPPNTQYFARVQQISRSPNTQPLLSPHAQTVPASPGQALGYAAHHPDVARAGQAALGLRSNGGTSSPGSGFGSPVQARSPLSQHSNPQFAQPPIPRSTSTPQMDTLADLASMQQQNKTARQNGELGSLVVTAAQVAAAQLATSASASSPGSSAPGSAKTPGDQAIPSIRLPRSFTTESLSEEDSEELNQVAATLHASALNYQAHIRMIKLLHKGLLNFVGRDDRPGKDGSDYELLADLRHARESMDSIYPLGEDLWFEWIDDEKALANTVDDRIAVMNLCTKAVTDEPGSAKLRRQYGDYMYALYAASNALPDATEKWSEEDRLVGKEVFTWTSVNNVWEQGVLATQWRMNDSNEVWDSYMAILLSEQKRQGADAPFSVDQLQQLFVERLTQPHATWDNTFQSFSMFVSENAAQDAYEDLMSRTSARASQAKQMWSLREMFELKISQAQRSGERDAEWDAFSEYLTWEVKKKGIFSGHLIVTLYERAVTRFSAEATLWEDYVEYLLHDRPANVDILHVLERATRHCPWSGSLWSHRLLALEAAGKDFGSIETVKHKATRTGILEMAGIEELLKVYIAWCGFLRRRAFENDRSDEDDLDVAEVGIRSALEHVREVGEQLYGKDQFPGDPQYRLERIHIKFFSQAGDPEAARAIWRNIAPVQRNSYDFWYRWYIWEMVLWAKFAMRTNEPGDFELRNPAEATAVLKQALQYTETLDSPERLVQMFLTHCEQHESVGVLQGAFILTRKLNKEVYRRRQQEAEVEEAQRRAHYEQQSLIDVVKDTVAAELRPGVDVDMADSAIDATSASSGKRKFESEEDGPSKKQRSSDAPAEHAADGPKRDREHTTVLIKKLPVDATTTAVRKFFRDSGTIVNIKLNNEADSSQSATVEFETPEDAQFALSRSSRPFEGEDIEITYACGATLWVSNYPPEVDEKFIRDLFEKYGEVIDVRFPSLKYNTHRRFCYVQFSDPAQALAATALNGTPLQSTDTSVTDIFKLIAKISAPEKKTDREGALQEGREVFVGQLSWFASEAELREVFGEAGTVERVRIPKNVAGKSKGAAFVTFTTKEEAQAAVAKLNGREIRGRAVTVEIAKPNVGGPKRTATSVVPVRGRSQTPAAGSSNGDVPMGGDAFSPASEATGGAASASAGAATGSNRKDRTLYLINIPDTVNDTRVRAFLEQFGQLRKLILRPDHRGAIAEFASVADAGRAEMKIPDAKHVFDEGSGGDAVVEAVDEPTFFKTREEYRSDKLGKGGASASKKRDAGPNGADGAAKALVAPRVNRPGLAGAGRRGGLGTKRGGVGFGGPRAAGDAHGKQAEPEPEQQSTTKTDGGDADRKPKSNDDFRAMLTGGK